MAEPTAPAPRPHSSPPVPPESEALLPLLSLVPALRVLIGLGIAALVISALYVGRELLIPVALAAFLGFLLDPAVSRLKRWGLPRALAVAVVSLVALAALAGAGTYLTSQLRGLSNDLPSYQDTIRGKIKNLRSELGGPSSWDGAFKTFETVQKQIDSTAKKATVQRVEVVPPEPSAMQTAVQWLERIGSPVATAGIVLLFVVLILLDRDSLRDRVLRLMGGGNLHLATDALHEATTRIGKYLRMQLIVNASYGVPMALGLYFIGVPGAVLWGTLATVMRFVPYVGPMISAVFPLALAFAVDPGWEMVLWTIGLIAVLELISNNVIEPWLYGSSTGLSTLSIIIAATFWTAIWGPIGLILSTPLTVCLLVMGRYIPSLRFMEALLGSQPVLDMPQRLYQRLLAGDVEEASDMATDFIDARVEDDDDSDRADALLAFYDGVGLPALRLASAQHADNATAQHRLRLASGMAELLEDLQEEYPAAEPPANARPAIHCIGARWEVDAFAATMAAHVLRCAGYNATAHAPLQSAAMLASLALRPGDVVCISIFHPQPDAQLRQIARRLHRRTPGVRVIAAPWSPAAGSAATDISAYAGVQASAASVEELLHHIRVISAETVPATATADEDSAEQQRVEALLASGALAPSHYPLYRDTARKAANAFDTPYAQISWISGDEVIAPGSLLPQPPDVDGKAQGVARAATICTLVVEEDGPLIIPDVPRDPRVAELDAVKRHGLGAYAGVPLRSQDGLVIGSLCVIDDGPRTFSDEDRALLQQMGDQLMKQLRDDTP